MDYHAALVLHIEIEASMRIRPLDLGYGTSQGDTLIRVKLRCKRVVRVGWNHGQHPREADCEPKPRYGFHGRPSLFCSNCVLGYHNFAGQADFAFSIETHSSYNTLWGVLE